MAAGMEWSGMGHVLLEGNAVCNGGLGGGFAGWPVTFSGS